MGMSTHVVGFRPPDEQYEHMKTAYNACKSAGVPIPTEIEAFFNWEEPDDHGVEVRIPHSEWKAEMREGIEVDVTQLPAGVKIIRFFNSY